jgi:hypothetical protein
MVSSKSCKAIPAYRRPEFWRGVRFGLDIDVIVCCLGVVKPGAEAAEGDWHGDAACRATCIRVIAIRAKGARSAETHYRTKLELMSGFRAAFGCPSPIRADARSGSCVPALALFKLV